MRPSLLFRTHNVGIFLVRSLVPNKCSVRCDYASSDTKRNQIYNLCNVINNVEPPNLKNVHNLTSVPWPLKGWEPLN